MEHRSPTLSSDNTGPRLQSTLPNFARAQSLFGSLGAQRGGGCEHTVPPRNPRTQLLTPLSWDPKSRRFPAQLQAGRLPRPQQAPGSQPQAKWRSAGAALASGAGRRDSLAPRPLPQTSKIPV